MLLATLREITQSGHSRLEACEHYDRVTLLLHNAVASLHHRLWIRGCIGDDGETTWTDQAHSQ